MKKLENHEQMREYVEKMKQQLLERKNKIEEMKSNTNYILWLQDFTSRNPRFTNDYDNDLKKLSITDKENIRNLGLFFECISNYASDNYIYWVKDSDFGGYFCIKYNNIGYKIGMMSGQGTYSFCKRVPDIDNTFIDFNDILLNKKQEKTEFIKEKLNELSNYIMSLYEHEIPLKALKKTMENCIVDMEELDYKHSKVLKKISK